MDRGKKNCQGLNPRGKKLEWWANFFDLYHLYIHFLKFSPVAFSLFLTFNIHTSIINQITHLFESFSTLPSAKKQVSINFHRTEWKWINLSLYCKRSIYLQPTWINNLFYTYFKYFQFVMNETTTFEQIWCGFSSLIPINEIISSASIKAPNYIWIHVDFIWKEYPSMYFLSKRVEIFYFLNAPINAPN